MAIELITVRRKDNPNVTAEISPRALRHFPDFERVDGEPAVVAPAENPAPAPMTKRRAAATDDKE